MDLPEETREEIGRFQSKLKKSGADVNWVKTDRMHLTLKFLGDTEENRLPTLIEALNRIAQGHPCFAFSLDGVGAFPKMEHPRILWIGIQEGREALVSWAQKIEEGCGELGFPAEERPFSAHLTVGRIRSAKNLPDLVEKLQTAQFRSSHPIPIDRVILFQSVLGPHGPTYIPLAQIPLGS